MGNDTLNEEYKKIIQWGYNTLISNGYTLTSNFPENVQDTHFALI